QRPCNDAALHRVGVRAQGAGELERVEGVPTRRLVHAHEGRACERQREVSLEQLVNGPQTQRADMKPFYPVGTDGRLELRCLRILTAATGEKEDDRPLVQPPQRK